MGDGGGRCVGSYSTAAVPELTQHLRSMTAAIAAAESCAMRHELRAGAGAEAAAAAAAAAATTPGILVEGRIGEAESAGLCVCRVLLSYLSGQNVTGRWNTTVVYANPWPSLGFCPE